MISTAARNALVNVGTNRQAATIPASTPKDVVAELQRAGLIGEGRGLTRRGTIERERYVNMIVDLF